MRRVTVKRIVGIVCLALSAVGCVAPNRYGEMLDGWVGRPTDELVRAWGPPDGSYPLSDGGKVIEYDERRNVAYYDYYFGSYVEELRCKTLFTISREDVIQSWKWQGNDCYAP
jgi:hypothetical protein